MNTKHYYHYATKGLENDYLFGSITAFVAAMNRIAICYSKVCETSSIIIIGFSLMDNHVHFILYGNEDDCDSFMALYKRLTEIWLTNHPEEGRPGKEWDIGHWQIKDKDSLLEKLSYVHRNPVVAFLPYTATGYRWSSACLPFADHSYVQSTARPLGTLNRTAQRKLLESKVVLPDNWLVLPDGMIWSGCYTDYKRIEKLYGTAVNYQYGLNTRCEDKVNREMLDDYVSLPDGEVRDVALKLSDEMFGNKSLSSLSVDERLLLGKKLKKETGTSSKQLARILRIRQSDLKQLL